ncbi:hypothetical protein ACFQL0_16020 [Haloplanus litoreus]|uniref:DUF7847 domain-containing protein n=1 Tax=Haloplanus litoreus TaxID=767515 RepID=UPI0036072E48
MVISLVFIFIMPFFQAGIVGMADEALDGQTSLESFVREGKSNYVSILVVSLVLVAVNFALGFVAFFVAIFGGFAAYSDTGGVGIGVLVIIGLIVALVVLAYLLVLFFVQFYSQAIVIDDLGAVGGLKHSVSVVRHHLVSTLGYSVLVGILGGIAGGVFAIGSLLTSPQSPSTLPLPQVSLLVLLVFPFSFLSLEHCSVASSASIRLRSIGRSIPEPPMVLDRKTASAALALVVIVLSQWPVVDSSPFRLAIFLCGGVLVTVLDISAWLRPRGESRHSNPMHRG